jgi:hypothetical protein
MTGCGPEYNAEDEPIRLSGSGFPFENAISQTRCSTPAKRFPPIALRVP